MTESNVEDRVVVLTGGTSGIGRIASRELAAQGATVAVIGRDRARGETLAAETEETPGAVRFHRADLAKQAAVRALATDLLDTYDRIDALVHNAGQSVNTRTETEDGIECTFAVNHLAPYLLTHELLDRLKGSAPARIVVTSSELHRRATLDFDDLQAARNYDSRQAYARSKLALTAFTLELAERLSETSITANCVHPGFVPSTNMFRDASIWSRIMIHIAGSIPGVGTSAAESAARLYHLITADRFRERTGTYVTGDGITQPAAEASDPETRERLWDISADLVGVDPNWP